MVIVDCLSIVRVTRGALYVSNQLWQVQETIVSGPYVFNVDASFALHLPWPLMRRLLSGVRCKRSENEDLISLGDSDNATISVTLANQQQFHKLTTLYIQNTYSHKTVLDVPQNGHGWPFT
jgi:hypothetical protein